MGRTKRKRIRKKNSSSVVCLDSNASVISLNQWMTLNNWKNNNSLRLSVFETTGRGLTSPKQIRKNDTLIEVPYEIMISFTTLEESYVGDALLSTPNKLKMHDILSIFLAFEQHKGCLSEWKTYIDTLPECVPPLPWLCIQEEIDSLPEELQSPVTDRLLNFKSSWQRSKESINSRWICECCKIPGHCVLTLNLFTWAYVMVNTRAVYVDPNIVRGLSHSANNLRDLLSDDPCMALCPYLDMFNHSNKAATDAMLQRINDKWMFRLVTTTPFNKYQEIFISYGSYHNIKLLCEYGFFISDVELDKLSYDFSLVLKIVKCSMTGRQYKFIHKRNLHQELSIGANGVSFNLKAVLFVIIKCDILDWSPYVFSESYTGQDKLQMHELAKQLVQFEIDKCTRELCSLTKRFAKISEPFENILNYLQYKLSFTKKMMNHIDKELL